MTDSWFFTHEGKVFGPANLATLRALAATGKLAPEDRVWAEGSSPAAGVPARNLVAFPAPPPPPAGVPTWVGDVRTSQAPPPAAVRPARPEWLEDVRQAEAEAAAVPVGIPLPAVSSPPSLPPQPPLARPPAPPQPPPEEVLPVIDVVPVPPPVPKRPTQVPPAAATTQVAPAKPLLTPRPGRIAVGGATSPGKVRERNEDSFLILQARWANLDRHREVAVVVVADGMGGHQAGDRASRLAIRAMAKSLSPLVAEAIADSPAIRADALPAAIDRAFGEAQRTVLEAARGDAACKNMGSTGVAVVVVDDEAYISLVGDCRVYHQRGERLTQLTRDQTLVARMVELGQLSEREAANHPRRNEITQAIGQRTGIQPVRYQQKLAAGDWLIVCCDGLYAHVDDETLQEAVGQWAASAEALAEHLVDLTNQLGGSDNCTVVAICRE